MNKLTLDFLEFSLTCGLTFFSSDQVCEVTPQCVTENNRGRKGEREISSPLPLKRTDGELNQCHRPSSSRLLHHIHSDGAQAALHSQRLRLITALMCGGLMLAQANAKGMHPPSPRPLPPFFVWNQKVGSTNKDSKSSGSGGGWLLLTTPPFSLSLARCVSPPLCLFLWLSLTMSGLSGMVHRQPPLMECYYVVPVSI